MPFEAKSEKDTKEGLIHNQQRQAKYYNHTIKDMDTLKAGDCVRVQPLEPNTTWKRARVVTPVGHRSYKVELDSRSVWRRNRRHLRRAMDTERVTPTPTRPVDTGETQVPTQDTGNNYSVATRSGCVVQKPRYLNDFVCN